MKPLIHYSRKVKKNSNPKWKEIQDAFWDVFYVDSKNKYTITRMFNRDYRRTHIIRRTVQSKPITLTHSG